MALGVLLAPLGVCAMQPEGLEAFANTGIIKRATSDLLFVNAGYVNPSWLSDYEMLQAYASLATKSGNFVTYGGTLTTGNKFGDRDGYFIRWDQTFSSQSLSLKLTHEDLRFINAGLNTISADYNADLKLGREAEFYLLLGMYYRFTLNRWNQPSWNPVNLNTEDREAFLEFCFGSRIRLGMTHYLTIDVNNRDPFQSYNGDNIALDFTINLVKAKNLTFRVTESSRFSGLLAGTADLGEERLLLGIVTSF